MASVTPAQQRRRDRVESLIGVAAPFLDLLLAAGDRVSRLSGADDDYMPIRPAGEAFELKPPGDARRSNGAAG